jgi:hypothetical protein
MEWDELVRPWREIAERHGFRLLERKVELIEGGHRCVDVLASGATFLDLNGELGNVHGFWHARAITWIDTPESRFSLTTIGEADPPPRPRGTAGFFAGLVVKLMHRLAPQQAPMKLRAPADLSLVIERHLRELLAIGGKPVLLDLGDRWRQQERDEAEA